MTIIAWDGKTLAADKAASNCGYLRTVTKIYRVPSGLVGFAGDGSRAFALLQWFRDGCDPAKYPRPSKHLTTPLGACTSAWTAERLATHIPRSPNSTKTSSMPSAPAGTMPSLPCTSGTQPCVRSKLPLLWTTGAGRASTPLN